MEQQCLYRLGGGGGVKKAIAENKLNINILY